MSWSKGLLRLVLRCRASAFSMLPSLSCCFNVSTALCYVVLGPGVAFSIMQLLPLAKAKRASIVVFSALVREPFASCGRLLR